LPGADAVAWIGAGMVLAYNGAARFTAGFCSQKAHMGRRERTAARRPHERRKNIHSPGAEAGRRTPVSSIPIPRHPRPWPQTPPRKHRLFREATSIRLNAGLTKSSFPNADGRPPLLGTCVARARQRTPALSAHSARRVNSGRRQQDKQASHVQRQVRRGMVQA
jgi:hypothetical protein